MGCCWVGVGDFVDKFRHGQGGVTLPVSTVTKMILSFSQYRRGKLSASLVLSSLFGRIVQQACCPWFCVGAAASLWAAAAAAGTRDFGKKK